MKIRHLFRRINRQERQVKSIKDYVEKKHCLCLFTVSSEGHINIKLNEDENRESEIEANKLFESYVKEQRIVHYFNYRAGLYKFYNNHTGKIVCTKIKPKIKQPIDLESLIATIIIVGSEYDDKILPPKYFSIIYKMLVDEVLGSGYKDLKATTFREMMKNQSFITEERSSFSKYLPHGRYPEWYYENKQFTRDTQKKVNNALEFASHFIAVYNTISFQSETNESIETAEETAE